ncbi:MAG: hypothetical protein ACKV19_04545 [Verrucomicrobiales bacterium]
MDLKHKRICHDLKTDRPDVGRPLPGILRLLPFGLYLSGASALAFSALFLWQFKSAQQARDRARGEESSFKTRQAQLAAEIDSISREAKRAEEARKWVQGSEPMQELLVTVVRSMRPTSALADLSLTRDKDDPRKIGFTMQVSSGGPTQLDETVTQLASALNYRPYFAQQKQEKGGEIAYSATLIKQDRKETRSEQAAASPAPTASPAVTTR